MTDRINLPIDGKTWWKRLGIDITPTEKELQVNQHSPTVDGYLASQEAIDARRLIQAGIANNDEEMANIGRQRLRIVLGKE